MGFSGGMGDGAIMVDAWQSKFTGNSASGTGSGERGADASREGLASHVAGLGAPMLKIANQEICVLIGYGFIRRVELADGALLIYASECIVQVVGAGLEGVLDALQGHQLREIRAGERGITHVAFLHGS